MSALAVLVGIAAACTAAPGPTPTPSLPPMATSAPTAAPTSRPNAPPTLLAFPELSRQPLAPGRYDSSPPFAIEFTFEIADEGWSSAHIHEEFFDVMRLDGPQPNIPTRWVAWGYPETIHGPNGGQPVGDLTPAEAIGLMSHVRNVHAANRRPFTLSHHEGVQVDLYADVEMTQIFGGEDGDLALEPSFDVRLGAIGLDPGLLLVMCFGPDGNLEDGCADAQPIIDSVELVPN